MRVVGPSAWMLLIALTALGTPRDADAEVFDHWLRLSVPQSRPNPWDNLELQVVTKFPHLRFDPGGVVSYDVRGVRVGVTYEGGHPVYASSQAPFLAIPLRIPFPLTPINGFDFAIGMNVPVVPMGDGSRAPIEMHVALTLQVDSVMRALASLHPFGALFKSSSVDEAETKQASQ